MPHWTATPRLAGPVIGLTFVLLMLAGPARADDSDPPVITTPATLVVEAADQTGADVHISLSIADTDNDVTSQTCMPASDSRFPIGTTTVTCTADDADGNTSDPVTFSVVVRDTTPPVLTLPADMTLPALDAAGAIANFTVSALDNIDGPVTPTCAPPSGSTFPLGTTKVFCNAHDNARDPNFDTSAPPVPPVPRPNVAPAMSFKVTVTDQTPPVITVPAAITVAPTTAAGNQVGYVATAGDNVDGTVATTCLPASGSTFPVGTTTVNCSAADNAGNTASSAFPVTITPFSDAPPVIAVPRAITARARSRAGAVVAYNVTAADAIDGTDPVSCAPASGSLFPIGTTTIRCAAGDQAGRTASASFNLTVDQPASAEVGTPRTGAGVATVVVTCRGSRSDTCTVKLELLPAATPARAIRAVAKPRGATLATKTVMLTAGHMATVRLSLDKAALGQLQNRRRLAARLRVTRSVTGSPPTTRTTGVVFRA